MAVAAGIAMGIIVGWLLLAVFRRLIEEFCVERRSVDTAIVLLTVPPYLVAGWISALVGWAVAVHCPCDARARASHAGLC